MALRLNKVFLAGNLTRDPQVRFLSNEKVVANFSLACNRQFKTASGETKEEVLFIDAECFGRTAELVGQYLTRGRPCMVEGRLKMDSWEDKEGNRRSKILIRADNVQFLGGRDEQAGRKLQSGSDTASPVDLPISEGLDDDPPF